MKIANFQIGKGRTFIIAELSANHGNSLEIAKNTIRAAKRAGADAIKLQTYTSDTITIDCKKDDFKIKQGTIWDGKYLYDLYKEAHTPWEWHAELFKIAKEEGLICFSSPFDKSAVDFLDALNTPANELINAAKRPATTRPLMPGGKIAATRSGNACCAFSLIKFPSLSRSRL